MSFRSFVLLCSALVAVYGQIPCDDAYGQYCAEESGFGVGDCLKKQGLESLTEGCINYIQLHDTCRGDINKHCAGKEFTGDALVCLSEWTKVEDLSAECAAALPKKETKERVLSDKEKAKAAKRRKSRKAAEKLAREL